MKNCIIKIFVPVAYILFSLLSQPVHAEVDKLQALSNQIKAIKWKLDRGEFNSEDLAKWTKLTIKVSGDASVCISENEAAIKKIQGSLDGLGEKVKDELADITRQRKTLNTEKAELEKKLAACNLYKQNSDKAAEHISKAEKFYFKEKYLVKGPHIFTLLKAYLENPFSLIKDSGQFFWEHTGFNELDQVETVIEVILVIVVLFLGFWIQRLLFKLESFHTWSEEFFEKFTRAGLTTVAHYLPWLLLTSVAATISYIETQDVSPAPFMATFTLGLFLYVVSITLIRLFFSPVQPASGFISYTPGLAAKLMRRLHVLALLVLIGYMAFYTVYSESIPELNRLLLRDIYSLLIVLNLIWLFVVLFKTPKLQNMRWMFIVLILVFGLSLFAEWSGLRNLGLHSRRNLFLTFLVFAAFLTTSRLLRDLFNAMDDSAYGWCKTLHEKLGVEEKQRLPGLVWVRLITTILLWGGFIYILLSAWDTTGSIISHTQNYLINGFEIGAFRIVPSKIIMSLIMFATILMFSGWMRGQMERSWLPKTTMVRGARDALVTITGYIMFVIALLVTMSVAGINLGNIAIIAGALSVGIGFGLQNIVNNFVSGLILLFERPIRKGDWIVVGPTEGYVKDIRIRSTRIATFDNSDVIVPNSELISNQVTNWMLESQRGRAIIKVGVAYGSDIEKVRYILSQIAEEEELVVKDGSSPKPLILFKSFGDSALEFELRVHLYDVDRRLSTVSRMNFAIDKAFREEGITIPFPQRDLHVKSMPDKGSSD